MIYLVFFCLSIYWFVISTSDIADGKLQTLSKLSDKLQKDSLRSNSENINSRLFNKELRTVENLKHACTNATQELSEVSSRVDVVDKLNYQTDHAGAERRVSSGVRKGNYKSDYVKLVKKHDQNSAYSYVTQSDYYDTTDKKPNVKDNEGPIESVDDVSLYGQSEPIKSHSDVRFDSVPQRNLKTNINVLNLDPGSENENIIESNEQSSKTDEEEDVRFRNSPLAYKISDELSNSFYNEHQQNPIYNLYVLPIFRKKLISRIFELSRGITPLTKFQQFEAPFDNYGPNSVAGTSLYGAYATANSGSSPYSALGYNEVPFGFGEGEIEDG